MQIEQCRWMVNKGWQPNRPQRLTGAQLVMLFGHSALLQLEEPQAVLQHTYPKAKIVGCSTAGEICGVEVSDQALVATSIQFEHTQVKEAAIQLEPEESSWAAGDRLGTLLDPTGLVHVLVLSDGLSINGSDLVRGLRQQLPPGVAVTGGLAGDGDRFQKTLVLWDGSAQPGRIAAIGLYSDRLKVGYGSFGGWIPFGTERMITKSQGNVLYELDGQPALTLYKKYLGEHAEGLPATGLMFPLSLQPERGDRCLVRTILSINEADQSLTFAGDIPEGTTAQLMHASVERLIDGAAAAAKTSLQTMQGTSPQLAILISCVGRKLLMRQRIEEELESVQDVLGQESVLTGFYSYGEICPSALGADSELHNQTMTITTFAEL